MVVSGVCGMLGGVGLLADFGVGFFRVWWVVVVGGGGFFMGFDVCGEWWWVAIWSGFLFYLFIYFFLGLWVWICDFGGCWWWWWWILGGGGGLWGWWLLWLIFFFSFCFFAMGLILGWLVTWFWLLWFGFSVVVAICFLGNFGGDKLGFVAKFW